MNIHVQFREENNLTIGFVEGEIDTFTAPILREELESIQMEEGQTIEVDLSRVTYMDSTGLGIFVGFYKKATREKVTLKLVGLTDRLVRLFEITGLKDLMMIEADERVGSGNESV